MQASTIIWDWNGTLINDLGLCISAINLLLERRNLPVLDEQAYRDVFAFPVKDYYEKIGFDFSKEDFSIPAKEYIDIYNNRVGECDLQPAALEVLKFFRQQGARQFVLSAMEHSMLFQSLKLNNIYHFFEGIAGLDDHFAVSKIESGKQLIKEYNIEKKSACMIGDTDHDFEVAQALGIHCILLADGHQSEERLRKTGATVVSSLKKLMDPDLFIYDV